VYQYSETNVLHFLFSLLRIKGLYMLRALLNHPHDSLHKRHFVFCVHVMSVGCTWCSNPTGLAPGDEQVMLVHHVGFTIVISVMLDVNVMKFKIYCIIHTV
jgi:hypothetical protein